MRKLYINQKVLSMKEKFTVLNDQESPVYKIVGSMFAIPKHFDIMDLNDNVIATVTKEPITWMPKFHLTIDGKQVATIKKQFSFLKPHYEISAAGISVSGDFWDMNFAVVRNEKTVGSVEKRWFSVGDKYEITINNPEDELLIVGLVVAIDYVKHAEAAARSSANG
ncbi:LURP-one-related/scramblase family protein [Companilactobacillus hulinensis]|uniref:LURP-one-related/scramblase family protein n=1 Tax=Companilactobacillus hulinensis TaxID=2486007 RepID=UPI000F7A205D|nr:LURP-one-related family protein [Companilactobacillus hulinensis]